MSQQVYTSVVRGAAGAVAGVIVFATTVLLAVRLFGGPAWPMAVVLVLVGAVACGCCIGFGGRIFVSLGPDAVAHRSGIGGLRRMPADAIRRIEQRQAGFGEITGATIAPARANTRHIVGRGPVLHIELASGEDLWLSIHRPIPEAALVAVGRPHAESQPLEDGMAEKRRPWFGSKRVGYGIRPQTWQGWLVTLGGAAILVVIVYASTGRL